MANSVDLVIGTEAIKQVETLISKLSLADAELLKISQSALGASKGISGISTPSGLDKAVSNTADLNAELGRQNAIIKALEIEIKKLSYARQTNNKQSAEEVVNQRILNQNAISEAKATSALVGAYDKLNLAHQNAFKTAQNIGAQYGITSQQFIKASEKANLLDTELKTLDTTLGRNNRHVGDYGRGYNALGNSINQLSREAPAFANSVNTGFMALSNNFPALFDAINGIRDKNKMLVAEGKPTVSLFKSLASAIFSWQTLLSVGVTLLTLYGGKIVDYITGNTEAQKAQKALNEEVERSKFAVDKETVQLKILTGIVNDHTKSSKDRKLAYDEIREILPGLTSQTYDNAIATGELARVTDLYIASLIARNVVEIKSKAIAERQSKLDYEMSKTTKERLSFWEKVRVEYTAQGLTYADFTRRLKAQDKAEQDLINTDIKSLSVDLLKTNSLESQIEKYKVKTKEVKDSNKAKKEEIEALRGTEKWYEAQINKLKDLQATTADTTTEYKAFTTQIELLEKALKLLKNGDLGTFGKPVLTDTSGEGIPSTFIEEKDTRDPNEWMKEYAKDVAVAEKATEALKQSTDNWLQSFSSEFLQNSGLGSLETFFDGTFDKLLEGAETTEEKFAVTFNAIAESAQEAFNFISNASQANFDNEYARIEAQKDISLKFAGEGTAAREKIEADYEKKRKEIANRENKAKQKQAIFNIAIDTAQAIMQIWSHSPDPTGISQGLMTGIISALGAAQIAMVASQKIPQYFDGTDNHIGGLMLVNDGAGSNFQEKVILPNGKEIMPEGRNVLMNAPKGTKVLTHDQQIMEMLNERGISMSKSYNSNGMTANEMDGIMSKHFAKIQTNTTTFDRKGFRSWSESNGNRTIQNNNRVSRAGFSV